MAYCYYCDACLDGECDECEEYRDNGLGYCICPHGEQFIETPFQRSRREQSIEARRKRNEQRL